MWAAVIDGPGSVAVKDIPPVQPADGRALVRVSQAGICGTDLKIAAGSIPVATPLVLGHEMTGRVEIPGRSGSPAAGTAVLLNPSTFCGRCHLCRGDRPYLCPHGRLLGRDSDGCFAEYVAADEALLHPIPDSVTFDDGALLQVLATCIHGQSAVQARPEDCAVVIGLGVAGLLHVQLLRERGVRTIVAVTGSSWKSEIAERFGASTVVAPAEAAEAVADVTAGRGAGIVVECAGSAATLAQAFRLAGAGATVMVFGITTSVAQTSPYDWYYKELTIASPRAARPRDYDSAVTLCAQRRLDLAPLVTSRFPLSQLAAALSASADPAQLKVVLDIAGAGA